MKRIREAALGAGHGPARPRASATTPLRTRWHAAIALCLLACLLSAGATAAGAAARSKARLAVRLGAPSSLDASAAELAVTARSAPGARCRLIARAGHSTLRPVAITADRSGRAGWSWAVPSKAPSGHWRLSATCSRGHRHGRASGRVLVRTASASQFGPLLELSTGRVLASAQRSGAHAAAVNPFPSGECTWWAAQKRPDLFSRGVHGNATDWLSQAQAGGVPTGSTPAAGAIAVFHAYTGGAGRFGHVAYVESVNQDHTITISEYNFAGYHVGPTQRRISAAAASGFIYGGPVGTPGYQPVAPPSPTGYHVYGASGGIAERNAPDVNATRTRIRDNGTPVSVACQTQSPSAVNGSTIWDRLDDGGYVADYYIDTPAVGAFTPSIARCDVPPPPPPPPGGAHAYQVYHAAGGVYLRNGPGTEYTVVGSAPDGSTVAIACQSKTASAVNGSTVWDLLSNGVYISDYYVNTPVVGDFTPGVPQCGAPTPQPPTLVGPSGSQPQAYHVHGTGGNGLFERSGPGSQYAQVGFLADPAAIEIACQTKSASAVNGSTVWDLLTDGNFVSDYYTDTPVVGDFSPGIAHCVSNQAGPRMQ